MRINNLAEALEEVYRWYESLHRLLEVEREQFLGFDAEGLIRTAAEKHVMLKQLKQAEGVLLGRKEELAGLWNLAGEEIGFNDLVDKAVAHGARRLKQLGGRLTGKAREISAQLQRNRAMFEEGLAFVNDSLACFQAAIAGEHTAYAPLGDSRQRKPGAVCLRREV
jgi:hypothetical protein